MPSGGEITWKSSVCDKRNLSEIIQVDPPKTVDDLENDIRIAPPNAYVVTSKLRQRKPVHTIF
jgi:hypothetical protein